MASPGLAKSPLLSPQNLADELDNRLLGFSISFGHFQQNAQGGSRGGQVGAEPGFAKGPGEAPLELSLLRPAASSSHR